MSVLKTRNLRGTSGKEGVVRVETYLGEGWVDGEERWNVKNIRKVPRHLLADDRDAKKTLTSRSKMLRSPISPILVGPEKLHLVIQISVVIDLPLDPYRHGRSFLARRLTLLESIHDARYRSEVARHPRVYGKKGETVVATFLTKGDPQGLVVALGDQQRVAALAVRRNKE